MKSKNFIDPKRVRRAFNRAAKTYDGAAILQKEICNRLLERLDVVHLSPTMILDAGTGTGEAVTSLQQRYKQADVVCLDLSEEMLAETRKQGKWFRKKHLVCGNIEQLPLANGSIDLIFSNLSIQWCNDLHKTFDEFWRVLKPEGLLVFTTFGPDTLKELRASWSAVDQSAHVNSFVDMHDVGDALLANGYADPVMESETLTVKYKELTLLMSDLRAIGANVTEQGHREGLLTTSMLKQLKQAYEVYRVNELLPASYEVVYGHAWKPMVKNTDGQTKNIEVSFQN